MANIFFSIILSIEAILLTSIFWRPFLVPKKMRVAKAAVNWLRTVASAAPLTPRLNTAMKRISSAMFNKAPIIRNQRGCFESPKALKTPEVMLNMINPMEPRKYI